MTRFNKLLFVLSTLLICAFVASPVKADQCSGVAGNLVVNCGFEGGTYGNSVPNGYTLSGSGGAAFVFQGNAHTGTNSFVFGATAPNSNTLSQTLTTTAGTLYQISFYAFNGAGIDPNNLLTVSFNGLTVFSAPIVNGTYQVFTVTGVATSTSTVLAFTGFNNPNTTLIDDLSVTALQPRGSAVPEPTTMLLLGTGLLGLAFKVRQRKKEAENTAG